MSDQMVLVTGAAGGRQGKTGRHVTAMLLERGIRVRAFVHRIDDRSEHLRALGAEVIEGDFLDIQSVQRAVRDVSSIYFAYPVQDGLLDATAIIAIAAHDAGITRLINLVMLRSAPDAPTPRMRQNYLSEQVFNWAAIGAAHVRATVFYENLRALVTTSLAAQGTIRLQCRTWGRPNSCVTNRHFATGALLPNTQHRSLNISRYECLAPGTYGISNGAVRVLSLFRPEEVDYWRDELKSHRRNSREIELITWAIDAATLRGRAHYGPPDEFAEYVFRFVRAPEGELWKFGAVAFSKEEDKPLARQVIDIFGTNN